MGFDEHRMYAMNRLNGAILNHSETLLQQADYCAFIFNKQINIKQKLNEKNKMKKYAWYE